MATYYISSTCGDDKNAGTSENQAWKSFENLSCISGGDTIKLKCGDIFFGSITLPDCDNPQNPTVLTSFGNGDKPVISLYKTALFWQPYQPNLWKLDLTDKNSFSGSFNTNTNVGFLFADGKINGQKKFDFDTLKEPGDFYSDDRFVYLYSPTKPGNDIQIACDGTVITLGCNCVVENLEICGCGGHGITAGHPPHDNIVCGAVISDCYIHHIGGSELKSYRVPGVRYGNGIELWRGGRDITIKNCEICNVYDVAFTMQGKPAHGGWNNVVFKNNILYGNEQSFEIWTSECTATDGFIDNCRFENNICIGAGKGWSHALRPDKSVGVHLLMYNLKSPKHKIDISNNVFYGAQCALYYIEGGNACDIPAEYHSDRNFIYLYEDTPVFCGKKMFYAKDITEFSGISNNETNSSVSTCKNDFCIDEKLISELKTKIITQ